jgi:hypothetical protein
MLIKVYKYIFITINKCNLILSAQQTYEIKYDLLNFLLKRYNLKYKLWIEKF